jgi:ABC-type transport system substrate-binding protein
MRAVSAGVLVAAGLLLAACSGTAASDSSGPAGPAGAPKAGGQLTVADPLPPSSLDPIAGSSGGDAMSLYPLYDRLVNFDPATLAPVAGLASAWKYTDPKTLVLTLRSGVTFGDGTPFNADAVKISLDRALTAETSTVKTDLSMIDSVAASGPLEVTVHLKRPDAALVLTLADRAGMIVSPAAVTKWGADFAQHPVGAGAYTFVQYQPNDTLVVQKNTHYWQAGKPYLDKITFKYITSQQTADNALKSHQVDLELNVALSDVTALKSAPGVSVVSHPSLLTDGCYLNFSRAPFSNVLARQALAVAINRDALNQSYAFGQAVPTSQVFPNGYWAADPALTNTFGFDAGKARDLLTQAGYPNGLSIKGLAFQGTGEVRKFEIIQQQLKNVGIDMKFDVKDVATAAKNFFTDKTYDLICSSWSGRPDPSQTASSLFSSASFYNAGGYAAPGMDDALAAAASAQSQSERATAFGKVTSLNQRYVVWLPLLSDPNVTAIDKKIQGLVPNLYGKIDVSFLWRS